MQGSIFIFLRHFFIMQHATCVMRHADLIGYSCPSVIHLYRVPDKHLNELYILDHEGPPHEVLHHLNGYEFGERAEEPVNNIDGTLCDHPLSQNCTAQARDHSLHKVSP